MESLTPQWKTLKKVGNYEISTQLLGAGTFAKTYLARQATNPKQLYACKTISKKQANGIDEETWKTHQKYFINRLQDEVRIWKELKHQNVVKFHSIIESSSTVYILLEYCEGGNLEKYLETHKVIPLAEAFSLSVQLLRCGNFLYSKGIIHRDIKPENILFSDRQLKVSDFGLAKILEKEDINSQKSLTIAGSPFYMAPEVLEGSKYGLKCDVWSAGVIMYQLFLNNLPFDLTEKDRSNHSILRCIRENKLRFPRPLNMKIYELLIEMLELDPNNRICMSDACERMESIVVEEGKVEE